MGFVYLIGEINSDNKYKIGSTRAKSINKRLKQLQTGNSNELFIKSFYETDKPFKLETMLHNRFKDNNVIGEWFEMKEDEIIIYGTKGSKIYFYYGMTFILGGKIWYSFSSR